MLVSGQLWGMEVHLAKALRHQLSILYNDGRIGVNCVTWGTDRVVEDKLCMACDSSRPSRPAPEATPIPSIYIIYIFIYIIYIIYMELHHNEGEDKSRCMSGRSCAIGAWNVEKQSHRDDIYKRMLRQKMAARMLAAALL